MKRSHSVSVLTLVACSVLFLQACGSNSDSKQLQSATQSNESSKLKTQDILSFAYSSETAPENTVYADAVSVTLVKVGPWLFETVYQVEKTKSGYRVWNFQGMGLRANIVEESKLAEKIAKDFTGKPKNILGCLSRAYQLARLPKRYEGKGMSSRTDAARYASEALIYFMGQNWSSVDRITPNDVEKHLPDFDLARKTQPVSAKAESSTNSTGRAQVDSKSKHSTP